MQDINAFISGMNPLKGLSINFVMTIAAVILVIGIVFWIMLKYMKFKYPVEIIQMNPLRIFSDKGAVQRRNGVQSLLLLKEKRRVIDFKILPAKTGLFGKKERIYLAKDESGDLRAVDIGNICFAFTKEDGQIIDLKDVYITDERNQMQPIAECDVRTEDGREIVFDILPRFIPQNNDVKSSFVNSVMETVSKYNLPSFWQQAQVFLVIIAGFVASIIIYIVNKKG